MNSKTAFITGAARDIANAIYFLASNEASYINSKVLTIDGGYQ